MSTDRQTEDTVRHADAGERLSLATLGGAVGGDSGGGAGAVTGPRIDPAALSIGIVHLGIGAFHRAHQAVLTEDAAAATGETCWGILGVTQRSRSVVDQLAPQDGLYGVLTSGRDSSSLRIIGSVRDVAFPGEDTERILAALAAPTTHVVTLTVTEKGYRAGPDGSLDLTDPDVSADVAALARETGVGSGGSRADGAAPVPAPARSPIGLLVRGLARRAASSRAPLTVVTCDNMTDNGRVVERLVGQMLDAALAAGGGTEPADPGTPAGTSPSVRDWLTTSVTFPSTMVDRIVPATTAEHHERAQALCGVRDDGLVVAEPFVQWVVEDRFAGPRPAWERAGATLTDDVAPYEQAKLRMLNATHSLLAYLGALKGHALIADAMEDPEIASAARALLLDDVVPTLVPPPGVDLEEYARSILERFANPATGHTTSQVAMDGSQKLPIRLFPTLVDRLAAGAQPRAGALVVAVWLVFVARGTTFAGEQLALDDPAADRLRAAAEGPDDDLVGRMLALTDVFGSELAGHEVFRALVEQHVAELLPRFVHA